MELYVEGSYAFHKKPPGRSKIWKKNLLDTLRGINQIHMNFQISPPSPHVATPAKVSTAATAKIMCNIEFIFVLVKILNKLIFLEKIIFEIS
jgi:hypothetical protein